MLRSLVSLRGKVWLGLGVGIDCMYDARVVARCNIARNNPVLLSSFLSYFLMDGELNRDIFSLSHPGLYTRLFIFSIL